MDKDPKVTHSGESTAASLTQPVEGFYFGCWQQVGHYYFAPGMRSVRHESAATPWGLSIDSEVFYRSQEWHLERRDGWTAIGRRDNTVDRRPGSHSTFIFRGALTIEEAELQARAVFPEIFARTGW